MLERLWNEGIDPKEGKWPGLRLGEVDHVDGMVIDRDAPVVLRDGTTIYVDIFRPENQTDEALPVLFTWSPYGKHAPKNFDIFPNSGVPAGAVSKHAVWEGPDPRYWCTRGYAVVNGDARGSWGSEGDVGYHDLQEALDGYDVIEWIAAQSWSNGRVGLAGVSYLATVQYWIASLNPPHLACINPWEGFSDFYRERAFHGGIPETNFFKFTQWSIRCSHGRVENILDIHKRHPLLDEYNLSKTCPDLSSIRVPAYVVADWGDQGLHTRGTIEAFVQASSEHKWLEVHGRKKWQYYYQQSSLDRQQQFYDRYLKGIESGVDVWPRVNIEIRDRAFAGTVRGENEWPLSRTQYRRLYLDASSLTLSERPTVDVSVATYNSEMIDDRIVFRHVFSEPTELTGGMRLRLWVSTSQSDDMDLFVQVDKLDSNGLVVPFVAMAMLEDGPVALGWMRVSHRASDPTHSSEWRPLYHHTSLLPLRKDEIVPVDIEIWPSSTYFEPGASISVTIQGNDIFRYNLKQVQLHEASVNKGIHSVYTGALYDSYLVVPVVPVVKTT
jgi:predicted acyl esterase